MQFNSSPEHSWPGSFTHMYATPLLPSTGRCGRLHLAVAAHAQLQFSIEAYTVLGTVDRRGSRNWALGEHRGPFQGAERQAIFHVLFTCGPMTSPDHVWSTTPHQCCRCGGAHFSQRPCRQKPTDLTHSPQHSHWCAQGGAGWLWLALAGSGWLWLALGGSHWLWLAGFG